METKAKNKKVGGMRERGQAFMLRYTLSLMFGWAFIIVLIATIGFVMAGIFDEKHDSLYYPNEAFALMLTSLIIFGVAHLSLAFSVGGRVKLDEKAEKVTKVLGTIYNIGLVGMATGFAVVALFPLIGWLTDLTDMEGREVAQLTWTGVFAVVLLLAMVYYQVRGRVRWVYPVAMGIVALVVMILFLAIPARDARDAMKDQKIIYDLESIGYAVGRYVDENGRLPENLRILDVLGLDRSINNFELRLGGFHGDAFDALTFTLCTDGFIRDMSGATTQYGDFGNHRKGYNCFDLAAYIWDYDYYYGGHDDDYNGEEFKCGTYDEYECAECANR
jgi:hypothetical protein